MADHASPPSAQAASTAPKLSPESFAHGLRARGFTSVTGVPDSTLKEMCGLLDDPAYGMRHTIAANEGCAMVCAEG